MATYLFNLLILGGRYLTHAAGKTFLHIFQESSKLHGQLLDKYTKAVSLVGHQENMLEVLHSRLSEIGYGGGQVEGPSANETYPNLKQPYSTTKSKTVNKTSLEEGYKETKITSADENSLVEQRNDGSGKSHTKFRIQALDSHATENLSGEFGIVNSGKNVNNLLSPEKLQKITSEPIPGKDHKMTPTELLQLQKEIFKKSIQIGQKLHNLSTASEFLEDDSNEGLKDIKKRMPFKHLTLPTGIMKKSSSTPFISANEETSFKDESSQVEPPIKIDRERIKKFIKEQAEEFKDKLCVVFNDENIPNDFKKDLSRQNLNRGSLLNEYQMIKQEIVEQCKQIKEQKIRIQSLKSDADKSLSSDSNKAGHVQKIQQDLNMELVDEITKSLQNQEKLLSKLEKCLPATPLMFAENLKKVTPETQNSDLKEDSKNFVEVLHPKNVECGKTKNKIQDSKKCIRTCSEDVNFIKNNEKDCDLNLLECSEKVSFGKSAAIQLTKEQENLECKNDEVDRYIINKEESSLSTLKNVLNQNQYKEGINGDHTSPDVSTKEYVTKRLNNIKGAETINCSMQKFDYHNNMPFTSHSNLRSLHNPLIVNISKEPTTKSFRHAQSMPNLCEELENKEVQCNSSTTDIQNDIDRLNINQDVFKQCEINHDSGKNQNSLNAEDIKTHQEIIHKNLAGKYIESNRNFKEKDVEATAEVETSTLADIDNKIRRSENILNAAEEQMQNVLKLCQINEEAFNTLEKKVTRALLSEGSEILKESNKAKTWKEPYSGVSGNDINTNTKKKYDCNDRSLKDLEKYILASILGENSEICNYMSHTETEGSLSNENNEVYNYINSLTCVQAHPLPEEFGALMKNQIDSVNKGKHDTSTELSEASVPRNEQNPVLKVAKKDLQNVLYESRSTRSRTVGEQNFEAANLVNVKIHQNTLKMGGKVLKSEVHGNYGNKKLFETSNNKDKKHSKNCNLQFQGTILYNDKNSPNLHQKFSEQVAKKYSCLPPWLRLGKEKNNIVKTEKLVKLEKYEVDTEDVEKHQESPHMFCKEKGNASKNDNLALKRKLLDTEIVDKKQMEQDSPVVLKEEVKDFVGTQSHRAIEKHTCLKQNTEDSKPPKDVKEQVHILQVNKKAFDALEENVKKNMILAKNHVTSMKLGANEKAASDIKDNANVLHVNQKAFNDLELNLRSTQLIETAKTKPHIASETSNGKNVRFFSTKKSNIYGGQYRTQFCNANLYKLSKARSNGTTSTDLGLDQVISDMMVSKENLDTMKKLRKNSRSKVEQKWLAFLEKGNAHSHSSINDLENAKSTLRSPLQNIKENLLIQPTVDSKSENLLHVFRSLSDTKVNSNSDIHKVRTAKRSSSFDFTLEENKYLNIEDILENNSSISEPLFASEELNKLRSKTVRMKPINTNFATTYLPDNCLQFSNKFKAVDTDSSVTQGKTDIFSELKFRMEKLKLQCGINVKSTNLPNTNKTISQDKTNPTLQNANLSIQKLLTKRKDKSGCHQDEDGETSRINTRKIHRTADFTNASKKQFAKEKSREVKKSGKQNNPFRSKTALTLHATEGEDSEYSVSHSKSSHALNKFQTNSDTNIRTTTEEFEVCDSEYRAGHPVNLYKLPVKSLTQECGRKLKSVSYKTKNILNNTGRCTKNENIGRDNEIEKLLLKAAAIARRIITPTDVMCTEVKQETGFNEANNKIGSSRMTDTPTSTVNFVEKEAVNRNVVIENTHHFTKIKAKSKPEANNNVDLETNNNLLDASDKPVSVKELEESTLEGCNDVPCKVDRKIVKLEDLHDKGCTTECQHSLANEMRNNKRFQSNNGSSLCSSTKEPIPIEKLHKYAGSYIEHTVDNFSISNEHQPEISLDEIVTKYCNYDAKHTVTSVRATTSKTTPKFIKSANASNAISTISGTSVSHQKDSFGRGNETSYTLNNLKLQSAHINSILNAAQSNLTISKEKYNDHSLENSKTQRIMNLGNNIVDPEGTHAFEENALTNFRVKLLDSLKVCNKNGNETQNLNEGRNMPDSKASICNTNGTEGKTAVTGTSIKPSEDDAVKSYLDFKSRESSIMLPLNSDLESAKDSVLVLNSTNESHRITDESKNNCLVQTKAFTEINPRHLLETRMSYQHEEKVQSAKVSCENTNTNLETISSPLKIDVHKQKSNAKLFKIDDKATFKKLSDSFTKAMEQSTDAIQIMHNKLHYQENEEQSLRCENTEATTAKMILQTGAKKPELIGTKSLVPRQNKFLKTKQNDNVIEIEVYNNNSSCNKMSDTPPSQPVNQYIEDCNCNSILKSSGKPFITTNLNFKESANNILNGPRTGIFVKPGENLKLNVPVNNTKNSIANKSTCPPATVVNPTCIFESASNNFSKIPEYKNAQGANIKINYELNKISENEIEPSTSKKKL